MLNILYSLIKYSKWIGHENIFDRLQPHLIFIYFMQYIKLSV